MGDSFLEALAKAEPAPGGGAAAAYGAAVGLALLEKIVLVELQRQSVDSGLRFFWQELLEQVGNLAETLVRLRDEDGRAYVDFAEARTSARGEEEVAAALEQAIECPLKIMEETKKGLSFAARAGKHCKSHLLSDLLVVCELLQAASQGACRIVQANLRVMAKSSLKSDYQKRLNQAHADTGELFGSVEKAILERAGFSKP